MKRVLVTGGAGYVGQVLVPKLIDAGCYVVVYDKMLFGEGGPYSKENVWSVSGDIRDMSFEVFNCGFDQRSIAEKYDFCGRIATMI